jgi:amino acid transporter
VDVLGRLDAGRAAEHDPRVVLHQRAARPEHDQRLHPDQHYGSSLFSSLDGHPWWLAYLAFAFPLTWTVIAYEAAACYIGECKNPSREIAMSLEGGYGVFVYTMLPISFVVVLGASALSNPDLVDPKTMSSPSRARSSPAPAVSC